MLPAIVNQISESIGEMAFRMAKVGEFVRIRTDDISYIGKKYGERFHPFKKE